ncbi:P-loop NTPase (plasmid) [Skermanella sp. TT6]|uniref:P-loop NTPase n=1 Tax=Skermanella cutis TaxID=2775420 RepID=A0ABX7BEF0_9PROT|nr:tyrosine-protein kinase domain-containing protein [Skermanella sp. TT6]QQP92774.1 P-loop NTPase [Skermanella sp. TT6]
MAQPVELSILDLGAVLWRRKFTLVGLAILGGLAGIEASSLFPPQYSSNGSLVVGSPAQVLPNGDPMLPLAPATPTIVATEGGVLSSPGLLRIVANGLAVPPGALPDEKEPSASPGVESLAERLAPQLKVITDKESNLIQVSFTSGDPVFSAEVVNRLLNSYVDGRFTAQRHAMDRVTENLSGRLDAVRADIANGERRVADLLRQGLSPIPEQDVLIQEIQAATESITLSQAEIVRLEAERQGATRLGANAGNEPIEVAALLDSPEIARLSSSIADLRAHRAQLSDTLGPRHPDIRGIDQNIAQVTREIITEARRVESRLDKEIAFNTARLNATERRLTDLRARTAAEAGSRFDIKRAQGDLDTLKELEMGIQKQMESVRAQTLLTNAQIITAAIPVNKPSSPNVKLFGMFGAIVPAGLVAFLLIILDVARRLRPGFKEIVGAIDAPLIGVMPFVSRPLRPRRKAHAIQTLDGLALRLEILASTQGRSARILLTSAHPGEGKSTLTFGLGRALAASGKRVLLVDCDLHKPRIANMMRDMRPEPFSLEYGPTSDRVDMTRAGDTSLHLLCPSFLVGAEPSMRLRSPEFTRLLFGISSYFDVILFDTPPVLCVPDAILVLRNADAAVLVVDPSRSTRTDVEEACDRLQSSGKRLAGVLISKLKARENRSYIYSGYQSNNTTRRALGLTRA